VKSKALYSESKPSTISSFSTGSGTLYAGDTTSTGGSTGGSSGGSTGGSTKGGKGKNKTTISLASFEQPETFSFKLASFPNPTVDVATVKIMAPAESEAVLSILDVSGREVLPEKNLRLSKGSNELHLDVSDLSAGSYLLRANVGKSVITQRLLVNR
jgi:hypothetical protein